MKYYLGAIRKYSSFEGRAGRKEFWLFCLFNLLFMCGAALLDNIFKTNFVLSGYANRLVMPYGYIYAVYCLFAFIPTLAAVIRRFHDRDRSGYWFFVILVPGLGAIMLLVLLCLEGTSGPNSYGPDPEAFDSDISSGNVSNYAPNNSNYSVTKSLHIRGLCGFHAGQKFSTTKSIVFGRDSQICNVVFPLEQPGISSVHCTVSVEDNNIYLTDNDSTYGTFLANGTKLSANQKMMLKNQDVFYLSNEDSKFEVRLD